MFEFLFKKENRVEKLIMDYLETLKLTRDSFSNALNSCFLADNYCEDFNFHIGQTHKYESKADDIQDKINNLMYGKALLPESRGDIMALLADMDRIPHLFEKSLYMLQTQQFTIPKFIRKEVRELVEVSLECVELMTEQATSLFKHKEGIRALMNTIDINESRCDHFERSMISKIFRSDLDPFEKLQIKEFIGEIGKISDQADRVAKNINIMSMKRRV